MLVSMTRDGAPHPHAGRDGDDAGAMSDGGLIEGVIPSSARAGGFSSKPASLSFAPTPMLVHHSALRLKDIQASSSGEKIQYAVICNQKCRFRVAWWQCDAAAKRQTATDRCGWELRKEQKERIKGRKKKTRPVTRPPVADGWAGAEMRVFTLSNSIITDRRTNGPTDQRTKPLIELRVRN